ncbi:MBL fold metallo-hydrolase [Ferrimonas pelagia]|uniref:MBL fold metallo-hydrolase n=1 Tax=Ferrimonas pelagia TaxID=1177826 RepID=A0ABP9EKX9_9GAMM
MSIAPHIRHHGAINGVTGSCHQLYLDQRHSVLIDCGLFQGDEQSNDPQRSDLAIDFDISHIHAVVITHCHIDHVGRLPYLLADGYRGPIFATQATAALLPLVIADALKVGATRDKRLIDAHLSQLKRQLVAIDYRTWHALKTPTPTKIKFQPAGHILGSAYIEIDINQGTHRVVFSGDLGATHTPLLPAPRSPYRADTLVIESTYGDHCHQGRKQRSKALKRTIERAVQDKGMVLIPAFSIGRTQELLYEIEQLHHRTTHRRYPSATDRLWAELEIIVDSPLAAQFTEQYRHFKQLWDKEARRKIAQGRHPLNFDTLYTVDSHADHQATIDYLSKRQRPAVIIAASGMCAGGRIVNYLEQFLPDPRADVLFVGYQAQGTPGRAIQTYGPKGGYVILNDNKIDIKAQIHTISGYSAHADQANLLNFIKRIYRGPQQIRIVHGDNHAKQTLASKLKQQHPDVEVIIPT